MFFFSFRLSEVFEQATFTDMNLYLGAYRTISLASFVLKTQLEMIEMSFSD